jgi:predicted AAA+ superfamily ATPase
MSPIYTRERELRALMKGMSHFGLRRGRILTFEGEEIIRDSAGEITITPVWKWLLLRESRNLAL